MEDITGEFVERVQASWRARGAPEEAIAAFANIPIRILREPETSMLDGMIVIARDDDSEIARLSWSTTPDEAPGLMQLIQVAIGAFSQKP